MEAGREEAPSAALLRRSPEHNVYIQYELHGFFVVCKNFYIVDFI